MVPKYLATDWCTAGAEISFTKSGHSLRQRQKLEPLKEEIHQSRAPLGKQLSQLKKKKELLSKSTLKSGKNLHEL